MILAILGFQSPFTDFCRDVCMDVLQELGRRPLLVELVAATSHATLESRKVGQLAQIGKLALTAGDEVIVAVSRAPDPEITNALAGSGHPFLALVDDPRRVAWMLIQQGSDPVSAVRGVAASAATLLGLQGDDVLVVHRDRMIAGVDALKSAVVSALRVGSGKEVDDAVERAFEKHREAVVSQRGDPTALMDVISADLGQAVATTIDAALSGFAAAFRGEALGRIFVARDLFYAESQSAEDIKEGIDVTGRERCLIHGPYFYLPHGKWTLRFHMSFSPECAGQLFSTDVLASKNGVFNQLGRVSFTAIGGRYSTQITFLHSEPDATLEFRLFLDRSAFDGRVTLGYVELQRIDADGPAPEMESGLWPSLNDARPDS